MNKRYFWLILEAISIVNNEGGREMNCMNTLVKQNNAKKTDWE